MTPRSIRRAAERKAKKELRRKQLREAKLQNSNPAAEPLASLAGQPSDAWSTQENNSVVPAKPSRSALLGYCLEEPAWDNPLDLNLGLEEPEPAALNPEPQSQPEAPAISEARLAANRANAQLSTGPTSAEGRAKSSLNAVKTALTGRTVLLPSDDAALYERHVLAYTKEFRPMTQRECDLVQSIADTTWRLKRIPSLEMAIYAQGRVEFADTYDHFEISARPAMIEFKTFVAYEKQLRNLHIQEARLRRRYEKEVAELRQIQQERDRREARDLDMCAKLYVAAKHDHKPFHPSELGFEFSMQEIEDYLEGARAAQFARATFAQDKNAASKNVKRHSQAA